MAQGQECIEYRRGMLEEGQEPKSLPVKVWRGEEVPAEVKKAIDREGLASLGGTYGDKNAGEPVEFDHLKLVLVDGAVEITVFNRGIALLLFDDERVRRIHRVLCKLDKAGRGLP